MLPKQIPVITKYYAKYYLTVKSQDIIKYFASIHSCVGIHITLRVEMHGVTRFLSLKGADCMGLLVEPDTWI